MSFNVSVIIPVYNAEKYIAKALESCLQFEEVKEVVVIDDGYPDNARQIIEEYVLKDNRVKVFQHPNRENRGASSSRNLGIRKATQNYIAFLDADDFYLPNRFENDIKVFDSHADADGCYNALGTYFYSDKAQEEFNVLFKGREITTVSDKVSPSPDNLLFGLLGVIKKYGYFSLDGLTVKRKALLDSNLFFEEDLNMHEDTNFIIKMAYYCKIFPSEIKVPTVMRGVHGDNRITANLVRTEAYKNANRYNQYKSLYVWTQNEETSTEIVKIISDKLEFYRLGKNETPKLSTLLIEILKKPSIIKNKRIGVIFNMYTSSNPIGNTLFYKLPRAIFKKLGSKKSFVEKK